MTGLFSLAKDFSIMSCSFLTSHPSGLIPIPFGLSASRPERLPSFSFFRFSVFFGKDIFIDIRQFSILLLKFTGNKIAKFPEKT